MKCQYCGKTLPKGRSKYCSDKCKKAYYRKIYRKGKVCEVCGKELKGRKRKFCSNECRMFSYTEAGKTCSICGKPLPKNKSRYCSKECSKKAYNKYIGEYNKQRLKKPKTETKPEQKKQGIPKKPLPFAEVCKLAREKGLSYGQYVAKYKL